MYYITGDPHGNFKQIKRFAKENALTTDDAIVVLGDAGINYYLNERDDQTKRDILKIPATLFCIHGNHEARPESLPKKYHETQWCGGAVYIEDAVPNLLFAKDGEVYDFDNASVLVVGGAYSVDKQYRLLRGWSWFADEQPNEEAKDRTEAILHKRGWKIDIVLTHTCPSSFEPTEAFLEGVDQSTVDKTTELWLDGIEQKLDYKRWYCGHWHITKQIGRLQFMYKEIEPLNTNQAWLDRDPAEFIVGDPINYYISDLHLGHKNIIDFCNRPFDTVEEMNETLIENWNARVRPCDHVYLVGDFMYRSAVSAKKVLEQLSGRKHLIVGNHDAKWMKSLKLGDHFESVDMMLAVSDRGRNVVLCHYPMMTWPGRKSFHVYGHIHNNTDMPYWPLLATYDNALNACVEVNGYQPVTLDELIASNEAWRAENMVQLVD